MALSDPRIVLYSWLAEVLRLEPDYYEPEKDVYKFSNGRTFNEEDRDPYS